MLCLMVPFCALDLNLLASALSTVGSTTELLETAGQPQHLFNVLHQSDIAYKLNIG